MNPFKEYTNAMIRQYFARQPENSHDSVAQAIIAAESLPDKVDQLNYVCTVSVVTQLSDKDQEILRRVFSGSDRAALAGAVRICAEDMHVSDRYVWHVVRSTSKEIARKRGLI